METTKDKTLNDTIIEQLNWRYATKKFDASKNISDSDWATLEEALRLSPSSYGLQPWKFLVVKNPELRKQLTPVSWKQTQIEDASHLVVVTHLRKVSEAYVGEFVKATASTQGVPAEALAGYQGMMVGDLVKGPRSAIIEHWTARQAYLAMGVFIASAALLKIDVCPMEGFDIGKYDEILGLNGTDYSAIAVLAAGYRSADDKAAAGKKVRFAKSTVFKTL